MSKAILLSGGLDSIALAYWKRPSIAFTINYGQRPAQAEIQASKIICSLLKIEQHIIEIDCSKLGSGDLLKTSSIKIAPSTEWWPYRNQLLITLACMKAVSLNIKELMLGSVLSDGFHKDGTETFYNLIDTLMQYQEGTIAISSPANNLSSEKLILESNVPPEILFYAHSCHTNNIPCGHCRGCFKYIDVIQNLEYANWQKPSST